jgi:PEGA domain
MGRVLLTGAMIVAYAGIAEAGPTRKVSVETEPPGATVYLNDTESGAVCEATPCSFEAPIGQTPIIVQLKNYGPVVDNLDVPKKGRPISVKFTLVMALATLVIETPAAKGASIRVDEEDKGKVPARIEVSGNDAHHVVVAMGGKTLYDDYVNAGAGDEIAITPKAAGTVVVATKDPDPIVTDDGGGGVGSGNTSAPTDPSIGKTAPERPRKRIFKISAVFDFGHRSFTYDKGTTPSGNIRNVDDTMSMGGLELELWPLANASHLGGLSLLAHYARTIIPQPVSGGSTAKSAWDSLEVSLRHRWTPGDTLALEVGGGFVRDKFGFDGDPGDVANTPDITYGALRIGGRIALRLGIFEPYVGAENRIVVSRGDFGDRFMQGTNRSASAASGYRAALGATAQLGPLDARVEGSIMRYSWTFAYDPGSTYRADAGTDAVEIITATLGIAY